MIQRWDLRDGDKTLLVPEPDGGRYVLHADHLAEMQRVEQELTVRTVQRDGLVNYLFTRGGTLPEKFLGLPDGVKRTEKSVIEILEAELQQTRSEASHNLDLIKRQGERIQELKKELAEARRLAQWTPITETDLPRGRDHLLYAEVEGMDIYGIGYYNRITKSWFINGREEHNPGVTHFRPIAPPALTPIAAVKGRRKQ